MQSEDDLIPVPVSAIQHWCYCERQCALIHVEQAFAENVHTLRGQAVHARVDTPGFEERAGVRVERSLPVWNDRLGLTGKADIVEFLPDGSPYPVEYKHGSRRKSARIAECDDLQLAAQAICLEEMTGKRVEEGALFYASSRRRRVVTITTALRNAVELTVAQVRAALADGRIPAPANDERCRECSLIDICQPSASAHRTERVARLFEPDE
ncbi:MAG: CRISPR-associated protein Cas4 [Burkholderiales bacterium]